MNYYYGRNFSEPYYPNMSVSGYPYYWRSANTGGTDDGHFLPPIHLHNYTSRPYTLVKEDWDMYSEGGRAVEYHHFYGINPLSLMNLYWYYQQAYMYPQNYSMYRKMTPEPPNNGAWPEGFTMKGELRWGKLERIYGPRKEVPEFVKDDLRRVYGTYPKTDVSITYQGGEFLVKGDPRVGEQEYKVEKKVIRQAASPEGDSVSEIVEKRKKKKNKR
ncbi:uncharacterized protein LOC120542745 [Polypterus senegalus]|nr:uncharacterized protein LOC120542745 [Polypterus senegalus]XP_039631326.1 uncharacterized protein LOC120542745 [Polypterus senegalus]